MVDPLDDRRLSPEALGVLCYLISRPNEASIDRLRERFEIGKDRSQRIMLELIEAGYIRREQSRDLYTMTFGKISYEIVKGGET